MHSCVWSKKSYRECSRRMYCEVITMVNSKEWEKTVLFHCPTGPHFKGIAIYCSCLNWDITCVDGTMWDKGEKEKGEGKETEDSKDRWNLGIVTSLGKAGCPGKMGSFMAVLLEWSSSNFLPWEKEKYKITSRYKREKTFKVVQLGHRLV